MGKKAVVEGIVTCISNGTEPARRLAGAHSITPILLTTKYYTADVDLVLLPASEFLSPTPATHAVMQDAEAVVFVLDATTDGERTRVQLEACEALLEVNTPGTALAVVNKMDVTGSVPGEGDDAAEDGAMHASRASASAAGSSNSAAVAETVAAIADWCLDHGVEHVPCSALNPGAGSHLREKVGIARVVEALHSTMWSNMRMLTRGTGAAAGGARAVATAAEAPPTPERLVSAATAAAAAAGPLPSMSSDAVDASTKDAEVSAARVAAAFEEGAAADDAEDGDDGPLDIGRLMAEMQSVRQAAVSGGQTDEQRRAAAARMAMKLFELLGGGDDGEEEGGGRATE